MGNGPISFWAKLAGITAFITALIGLIAGIRDCSTPKGGTGARIVAPSIDRPAQPTRVPTGTLPAEPSRQRPRLP